MNARTKGSRDKSCGADGSTEIEIRRLGLRKHAVTAREALEPANPHLFSAAHIITDVVGKILEGKVRIRFLQSDLLPSRKTPCLDDP